MSQKTKTPHTHLEQPHKPRRKAKAKPKFEVPVDAGLSAQSAGWVSPDDTVQDPIAIKTPLRNEAITPPLTSDPHPFMSLGVGLFSLGAATIARASLTAVAIATAPLRVARSFFSTD